MKEKRILLTAIGSFSARAIIKRLKELGFFVFGMDCYPKEWVVNAALVDGFIQVPLVSKEEDYEEACFSIVENRGIDAIFPLTDIEVDYFYKNRKKYEEKGIVLLLPKGDLSLIRNKYLLGRNLSLSMEKGFSIIEGKSYEEMDFSEPEFPLVAKLKSGRSSEGLHY
ncbi:MAG: carboxylate--amine ligase, partial [Oribacterium parvum]|nr:carboxylate--amine ligase [Oribacterium parvum]